jgi:hypothetical protein
MPRVGEARIEDDGFLSLSRARTASPRCAVRGWTNDMVSSFVILTVLLLVAVDAAIERRRQRSRQHQQ